MYLSKSELKQLDLLKKKKPAERFLLMTQLIQGQIEFMKAGIKYRNPDIDGKELERCLRERMMQMYSLKP
jgi:hypothetical protein